jgi:hypothetical protein
MEALLLQPWVKGAAQFEEADEANFLLSDAFGWSHSGDQIIFCVAEASQAGLHGQVALSTLTTTDLRNFIDARQEMKLTIVLLKPSRADIDNALRVVGANLHNHQVVILEARDAERFEGLISAALEANSVLGQHKAQYLHHLFVGAPCKLLVGRNSKEIWRIPFLLFLRPPSTQIALIVEGVAHVPRLTAQCGPDHANLFATIGLFAAANGGEIVRARASMFESLCCLRV